jgi:hypothetical protein
LLAQGVVSEVSEKFGRRVVLENLGGSHSTVSNNDNHTILCYGKPVWDTFDSTLRLPPAHNSYIDL